MALSRRDLARLALGSGAAATLASFGLSPATAQSAGEYRALVTIFLYGGNDGWNCLVPMDERHQAYGELRGPSLAIGKDELIPLGGGHPYGMHPALAPLKPVWDAGHLSWVMNVGTLVRPIDRDIFWADPSSRPSNLSSHSDEQAHWQSMRPGSIHPDGVLGRMADLLPQATAASPLVSTNGANLALLGRVASPLILPLFTTFDRVGWDPQNMDPAVVARRAAANAFAAGPHPTKIEAATAAGFDRSYAAADLVNPILTAASSVDRHFEEDGAFRDSQCSRQLRLIARTIAARSSLGHGKQLFYAGQGDYDTHANQVAGGRVLGAHADLLADLALSLRSFYDAMVQLGLADRVTVVTMSDFGRTYRGNSSAGSDHAWGNVHFAIGGALKPRAIHGTYPRQILGAGDDSEGEGTFIPTLANEEYIGAAAQWFGVSDMSYVFPNWGTWSANGRGPVPMFA
ncbi:DUF1501 domain-containing protein [Phenylobacterium kunshanense]|uniref:DUF1501 domain-containing protein n=1 Tax=Phenylobacterium kunshanense TaxID=1445034 RepID=A0A328BET4_9CAUL|nr:DUF1501 domain-containing protein [Phenylobacterium kunshanense]RAK64971.1 hypothetical protein DJ019_13275 [Phenylobacterium kunshanense]